MLLAKKKKNPYFVFPSALIQHSKKEMLQLLLSLSLPILLLLSFQLPRKQWIHYFSPFSSNGENNHFSNLWLLFTSSLQWLSKVMVSATFQTAEFLSFNYRDQPNCLKSVVSYRRKQKHSVDIVCRWNCVCSHQWTTSTINNIPNTLRPDLKNYWKQWKDFD